MMKIMVTLAMIASLLFATVASADDSKATIWVFGGKAVSNSVSDTKSNAWGIYQETPSRFGTWDLGYLNEGHQPGSSCITQDTSCWKDKRDGIFALYDMQYKLNQEFRTTFAIGPYYTATTITASNGVDYHDAYRLDLLAKASIKYSLNQHWGTEFGWWHVLYSTNDLLKDGKTARGDADVFTVGVGYSF